MIPITTVRMGPEEEELVLQVLRSGALAQGAMVEQFEQEFAALHGVRHAVAVNNGTTALVVALEAIGIRPGDEVITSPFTFVATLNAILEAGATARFADIDDDFNVRADAIKEQVTGATRAIMPVHLYGYPADMGPIMEIAGANDLHVVEDAAQAIGATYDGRAVGSFGLGCFSLYATKNITTGEGGVVTTNDDALADRLRLLRNQGMRQRYEYVVAGHNYRLTNVAAAIGLPQLRRIADTTAARRRNAARLTAGLEGITGLVTPPPPAEGRSHVYHQYTIRVTADAPIARDDVVAALSDRGIGAGIYYPKVVFDYDCYRTDPRVIIGELPTAQRIVGEVISLPVHPHLSDDEIDQVIDAVRTVLR